MQPFGSGLWKKLGVLPGRAQFLEEMNLILTGTSEDVSGTIDWVRRAELEDIQERTLQNIARPSGGSH